MAHKSLNLVYAIKDGAGVSIANVESGLKCGCICPACGESLVAKKGNKVTHHFAHYSGSTCEYGYETSLHLMAKEILSTAKTIVTPKVYVSFPGSSKEKQLCCDARQIQIDKVEVEHPFHDVVPDVVVYSGKRKFFLEVYVTHPVDEEKRLKLKRADVSTLEIDLSKIDRIVSYQDLQQILLHDCEQKKWIYNAIADNKLRKYYIFSERIQLITRGFAIHAEHCPIRSRVWHGKAYANFLDDCVYCPYLIAHYSQDESNDEILCSGKYRIATLQDLAQTEKKLHPAGK